MNYHQNIEDILKAATPEQRLFWNSIFLTYGERVPIAQLFYQGAMAGSIFEANNPNRIFIGYDIQFFGYVAAGAVGVDDIRIYNTAGAILMRYLNTSLGWDTTGAAFKHAVNPVNVKNTSFAYLARGGYDYIIFNGFTIAI